MYFMPSQYIFTQSFFLCLPYAKATYRIMLFSDSYLQYCATLISEINAEERLQHFGSFSVVVVVEYFIISQLCRLFSSLPFIHHDGKVTEDDFLNTHKKEAT